MRGPTKLKSTILAAIVGLWLLSLLLVPSGAAFRANSVEGLAGPYLFNLPAWESTRLWDVFSGIVTRRDAGALTQADIAFVRDYFRQGQQAAAIERQLADLPSASATGAEAKQLQVRLDTIKQTRATEENRVRTIITRQIAQVMEQEGISQTPPLSFAFATPPQILVISPRDRIELKETLLLDPNLSLANGVQLEQRVEALPPAAGQQWGLSAFVEPLGGLALYPSLVPDTDSLEDAIPTVAHEWTHQYLFFHPLGQKYGTSEQMTTINETVADTVGNEVGDRVLEQYGITVQPAAPQPAGPPQGFSFNQEMRQTRLKVDALLAEGNVPDAEAYMTQELQVLTAHGYHLRRLNQAYFAFHGSYGNAPESVSPVGAWIRNIRARSPSLGEFLRVAAGISSYDQLQALADGNR